MRKLISMALIFTITNLKAQDFTNFILVDNFKINEISTKVYFKDPLQELMKKYPDFDQKDNNTKHQLLNNYLANNTLYIFQTTTSEQILKNYSLKGNPRKLKSKYLYELEIASPYDTIFKTIDKTNIGGSFFEHMFIFQSEKGKNTIGKGIQIWDYFVMVEPYLNIKNNITRLINLDIQNSIPQDLLAKKEVRVEPLFEYQKYGLKHIKNRYFTTTVFHYDSLGNEKNKYTTEECDSNLYLTSTNDELIGVTTFPFFSMNDNKTLQGNSVLITSNLDNINNYLIDIKVFMFPNSEQVEKIEGKLIIHEYSTKGNRTSNELYIAEFERIKDCYLPKTIKFCPISDKEHRKPRIVIDIKYELN